MCAQLPVTYNLLEGPEDDWITVETCSPIVISKNKCCADVKTDLCVFICHSTSWCLYTNLQRWVERLCYGFNWLGEWVQWQVLWNLMKFWLRVANIWPAQQLSICRWISAPWNYAVMPFYMSESYIRVDSAFHLHLEGARVQISAIPTRVLWFSSFSRIYDLPKLFHSHCSQYFFFC